MSTGPEGIPGIWGSGFQRGSGLGPAGTAQKEDCPEEGPALGTERSQATSSRGDWVSLGWDQ